MKKFLCLLLALLLTFSLCCCSKDTKSEDSSAEPDSQYSQQDDREDAKNTESTSSNNKNSASNDTSKNNTSNNSTITNKTPQDENKKPNKSTTDTKDTNSSQKNEVDSEKKDSEKDKLTTPINPVDEYFLKNNHTQLEMEKYYQYSFLNDVEKEAYRRIRAAVLSYQNNIYTTDLEISMDRLSDIVHCFMEDNPQYFWLGRSFGIGIFGDHGIILSYSDGVVTDHTRFGSADRSKIDERRKTFNQAIFNIVSSINPAASQYEKELAIHDYLTKNIKYDKVAENTPFVNSNMDSAYNAFGAIVEKDAVCSGYTTAFQYLCYLVGINCNTVNGRGHVWNTVEIDGEWYQVDVTWDDPVYPDGSSGAGNHDYFNLTSAQMYETHQLSTEEIYDCIKIPNCTATKYAYK